MRDRVTPKRNQMSLGDVCMKNAKENNGVKKLLGLIGNYRYLCYGYLKKEL